MGYTNTKSAAIAFNPALFLKQDREFNSSTMDRKTWLKGQIINVEHGIFQYNAALLNLSNQAAQLDGKSTAAEWMTAVGALALNMGLSGLSESSESSGGDSEGGFALEGDFGKYSAIAGAALIAAGVVINIFKKKKDDKRLQALYQDAIKLTADVKFLETLRQRYQSELTKITVLPIFLFGAAIYLYKYN